MFQNCEKISSTLCSETLGMSTEDIETTPSRRKGAAFLSYQVPLRPVHEIHWFNHAVASERINNDDTRPIFVITKSKRS